MAMFGTFIAYVFAVQRWAARPGSAICSPWSCSALGAAVIERVLIRPFDPRNHLAITIVTLGLVLILDARSPASSGRFDPRAFPTPFPGRNKSSPSSAARSSTTDLVTWITILVAVFLVTLLLRKTKIGLAFRVGVDQPRVEPSCVGIHIGRTLQFGWALAAAVGTLAGCLIAHTTLLEPELHGPGAHLLVRRGDARRPRQPRRRRGRRHHHRPGRDDGRRLHRRHRLRRWRRRWPWSSSSIVLLVKPNGLFGSQAGGARLMALVTLTRAHAAHRVYQSGAWAARRRRPVYVMFAYGRVPGSIDKAFRITQINDVICYAVAILGLNLVIGYSGQISLGHSAFVGLGAYTTIILVADHHWSYFTTIPVAVAMCFVARPPRRPAGAADPRPVPGDRHACRWPSCSRRSCSSTTASPAARTARSRPAAKPSSTRRRGCRSATPAAWRRRCGPTCILIVIAVVLFIAGPQLRQEPAGRARSIAVRDNQTSAAVSGVNLPMYKTLTFGVSAAFGGVAGSHADDEPAVRLGHPVRPRPGHLPRRRPRHRRRRHDLGRHTRGARLRLRAVLHVVVDRRPVRHAARLAADHQAAVHVAEHPPGRRVDLRRVLRGPAADRSCSSCPAGSSTGFGRLRARVVKVIPNPAWLRPGPGRTAISPRSIVRKTTTTPSTCSPRSRSTTASSGRHQISTPSAETATTRRSSNIGRRNRSLSGPGSTTHP